jgi:hypothetical protein
LKSQSTKTESIKGPGKEVPDPRHPVRGAFWTTLEILPGAPLDEVSALAAVILKTALDRKEV